LSDDRRDREAFVTGWRLVHVRAKLAPAKAVAVPLAGSGGRATALALGSVAMLALLLIGGPARADVIDGDWCHEDGRHFSIQGASIVTPAGRQTQGQYTRHSFRYTVPGDEAGSGQDISMQLLNELTLRLWMGADGAPQTWHRCKPRTS
jgi:hypothetical protein